jgi:hypothetical protein
MKAWNWSLNLVDIHCGKGGIHDNYLQVHSQGVLALFLEVREIRELLRKARAAFTDGWEVSTTEQCVVHLNGLMHVKQSQPGWLASRDAYHDAYLQLKDPERQSEAGSRKCKYSSGYERQ